MENSTKALIIVASVLIVIILIAVSIRILNSPKDTVATAEVVGEGLTSAIEKESGTLISSFYKTGERWNRGKI